MADEKPVKLTKPEMARLIEVATTGWNGIALKPKETARLLAKGILRSYRRHGFTYVEPTGIGIRILAECEGSAFSQFRAHPAVATA